VVVGGEASLPVDHHELRGSVCPGEWRLVFCSQVNEVVPQCGIDKPGSVSQVCL